MDRLIWITWWVYSVSDIQDYFWYIIRKHKTLSGNSLIRVCIDKIENRIRFKIKSGYFLELLAPGTDYLEALRMT